MRILTLAWRGGFRQELLELCNKQQAILGDMQEILDDRNDTIRVLRMAMDKADLQHAKAIRNLTSHFLEALEEENIEALRDGIEKGLSDLNDHVARLEEHSGI